MSVSVPGKQTRREKRSPVDPYDNPFELLSLAVRLDESASIRYNINLLEEPLESGRLYNNAEFLKFLEILKEVTAPPKTHPSKKWTDFAFSLSSRKYSKTAMTPIILSGLISAQREGYGRVDSVALMSHAVMRRRAALTRLFWHQRRRLVQRILAIVIVVLSIVLMYVKIWTRMRATMIELGYMGIWNRTNWELLPCDAPLFDNETDQLELEDVQMTDNQRGWFQSRWTSPPKSDHKSTQKELSRQGWSGYREACFEAESNLWALFGDYFIYRAVRTSLERHSVPNEVRRHLSAFPSRSILDRYKKHGPYSMHTLIHRDPLDSLGIVKKQMRIPQRRDSQLTDECSTQDESILRLGNSPLHELVLKSIQRVEGNVSTKEFNLLDVGCGVGGLAYTLSAHFNLLQNNLPESCWVQQRVAPKCRYNYHGISLSSAEVHHARTFAVDHGMDPMKVSFAQTSYDDPSAFDNNTYSAIVAIEALSYSRNISVSLSNLVVALKPGGLFVIVTDSMVEANSSVLEDDEQPSLLSHEEWVHHFESVGLKLKEAIDLGLHFDLPQLVPDSEPTRTQAFAGPTNWLNLFEDWWTLDDKSAWFSGGATTSVLEHLQMWIGQRSAREFLNDSSNLRLKSRFASLRIVQLFLGDNARTQSESRRKARHKQGEVTYNMYICTKR